MCWKDKPKPKTFNMSFVYTWVEVGPKARSNLNVFVVDEFGFSLTTTSFAPGTSTTEQERCDFSDELRGLNKYINID